MSSHFMIYGFVPPDAKWKAHVKALEACHEAKIPIPGELEEFLGLDPGEDQSPDPNGWLLWLLTCDKPECEREAAGEEQQRAEDAARDAYDREMGR